MQNIVKFTIIFLLFTFFTNVGFSQNAASVNKEVKNQKVKQATKSEVFYVDVRTPSEFAQGSVTGAVNIPLDQIENQIAKFKGKQNIVVFCRSGSRSSRAKNILEKNGINNVTNGGTWKDVNAKLKK